MKIISIKVVDTATQDEVIDVEGATWPDTLVASFLRALADEISPRHSVTPLPPYQSVPMNGPFKITCDGAT